MVEVLQAALDEMKVPSTPIRVHDLGTSWTEEVENPSQHPCLVTEAWLSTAAGLFQPCSAQAPLNPTVHRELLVTGPIQNQSLTS